jgi:hypothetical protein
VICSSFRIVETKNLDVDPFPRQILSKLTSTWESIPHKQYEQSMCETMLPGAIWVVIGPQLECLYTEFLLYKLLISQNEGNRDKMIRTSHEILQLALSLLKKNDVIATPNLEGMVSCEIVSLLKNRRLILIIDGVLRNAMCERSYLRAISTESPASSVCVAQSVDFSSRHKRAHLVL